MFSISGFDTDMTAVCKTVVLKSGRNSSGKYKDEGEGEQIYL